MVCIIDKNVPKWLDHMKRMDKAILTGRAMKASVDSRALRRWWMLGWVDRVKSV